LDLRNQDQNSCHSQLTHIVENASGGYPRKTGHRLDVSVVTTYLPQNHDLIKTRGNTLLHLGNKQIEKIICVACSDLIGDHSRRQLARCLFRIQGTFVSKGIENQPTSEKE